MHEAQSRSWSWPHLVLRYKNELTYSASIARKLHSLCIRARLQACRRDAFWL